MDLGLPDMDGLEIIQKVRRWGALPIVVVSARTRERDKIEALDAGADDFITKPFGGGELLARIRTALRHTRAYEGKPSPVYTRAYQAGDLTIDFDKRLVQVGDEDVHLTQSEYKIVCLLAQYAGRVLTYDFIIREIWGPEASGDTQNLRANMAKIRRKLEKNPAKPRYIFTEVGVGYRMVEGE
ncbi:KDP operon transcriptional regulatory protein KdpE [anaerobic digester metagenome]